jgi:hypothetical protein
MSPQDVMELERLMHALNEEYWNGSDTTVTEAINGLADRAEEIRTAWMNGRGQFGKVRS